MSKKAMKLNEIMEQAQVFASAWSIVGGRFDGGNAMDDAELAKSELRQMVAEALAEQPAQQEPVATLWQHGETGRTRITMPGDITDCDARWFKAADLYTSPPAQRTWVGLTKKEVHDLFHPDFKIFHQRIEAKLKEKNT